MSSAPADADPLLGTVVSGFRIERLLGRGGMGQVYLGRRSPADPQVVLKFLAPECNDHPELLRRFAREAQLLSRLRPHPNVVGVLEVHADARPAHFVMELAQGTSLGNLVRERGPLPPPEGVRAVRDAARGLAHVHAAGLVHRDIKPDNLIVDPQGRVKLVDFGLARDAYQTALTRPGQLIGTSHYMAPEQWSNQPPDARCDVFALGCTLYCLLTGEPPFQGDDLAEVMEAVLGGEYEPLASRVRDLPAELDVVLAQMLATEPELRYRRCHDLADDLDRVLRGEPTLCPRLEGPGLRVELVTRPRVVLGRKAGCDVVLAHPGVSAEHAQVSFEEAEFLLRDFRSPEGTFVDGERIGRPWKLKDGQRVRLGGELELTFFNPRALRRAPPHLEDVTRAACPEPVVDLLARLGDPRTSAWLLERLVPDAELEAALARDLAPLLGEPAARAVLERRRQLERDEQPRVRACLAAIAGEDRGAEPAEWLLWWDVARTRAPVQLAPAFPPGAPLRLRSTAEPSITLPVPDDGVLPLGRDARCPLRIDHRSVSRHHATLLRLHRRLVLRDEGSPGGLKLGGEPVVMALLQPGDTLTLGELTLRLEAQPLAAGLEALAAGRHGCDRLTFEALLSLEHPAATSALVELGARGDAADVARRWGGARAAEVQAGYEAAVLRYKELAAARGQPQGPQLVPLGWS